jgi:radical SAM protein with 4Fe4S-binding SPASM domain
MPFEIFTKAVDEAIALEFNGFAFAAFGDPLMDNKLGQRFMHIRERESQHIKIGITTTGHLLKGKMLDLVCEYVDIVKISNYGFTKRSYESVHRGVLKYEEIRRNIDEYLEVPNRPYTIMTFLDLPENHEDIEAWKAFYEPKVDRVDIWRPHNWGGITSCVSDAVIYSLPCRRVNNLDNMIIRSDGRVAICCFDLNSKLILGDIKSESLENIINSERTKEIQTINRNKAALLSSNLPCKHCDQIRDRQDALIYSSDKNMKVGKCSIFHD